MQRNSSNKSAVRSASTEQQVNMRSTRKSLKTLQHVATDKENLTGRPTKITGKDLVKDLRSEVKERLDLKRKKLASNDKSIQVGVDNKIDIEDLTSEAGPSENYWQVLAEKRGTALAEALEENQELHEKIEQLEKENRLQKAMLEETENLVEVLRDMVGDQEESGIDLAEASTVSETDEANINGDEETPN